MNVNHRITSLVNLVMLFWVVPAYGQQFIHKPANEYVAPHIFQMINKDAIQGQISKEDALLNKFYYVFDRKKLEAPYKSAISASVSSTGSQSLKCFTPVISEYLKIKPELSASARQQIHSFLTTAISGDDRADTSKSGRFVIFYTTIDSTGNAVPATDNNHNSIPDYVEWAASYADSVWNCEVRDDGFDNPLVNSKPYHIYIAAIGPTWSPVYGYTTTDNNGSTYIVINNNFGSSGFPPNSDPDGKLKGELKVTIAHEFKHAIEFKTNQWRGESAKWLEMDATMMEDVVFDPVDDYYNYLGDSQSIFSNPQYSLYPGSYDQVTWAMFFLQEFGIKFWRQVWNNIGTANDSMTVAMTDVLHANNITFGHEFTQSELWHYSSGVRTYPNYGFKDTKSYPTSRLALNDTTLPYKFLPRYSMVPMSADYERIVPTPQDTGQVLISFFYNNDYAGLGLLALTKSNTTSEIIFQPKSENGVAYIKTPLEWGNIQELGLVSTNFSTMHNTVARVLIGANKILYGDMDGNGVVNINDAYAISNVVLGNNPEYADAKLVGDISGNGTISAYDAALLLRHLAGNLPYFTKDLNHDGFGPEYSAFETPQHISYSDLITQHTYSLQPHSIQTISPISVSLNEEPAGANSDARLSLNFNDQEHSSFSSLYLQIQFPSTVIPKIAFDTTGSLWKKSIFKSSYHDGLFRLAVAEPDDFSSSGLLGSLNLTASMESDVTVSIKKIQFDESQDSVRSNSFTLHIKPQSTTPIKGTGSSLPKTIKLDPNFPNPFNPSTNIKYELPALSHVTLTVYDITGRKVETLLNTYENAGIHIIQFDASNLASGMYIYQINVESHGKMVSKQQKMLLIK